MAKTSAPALIPGADAEQVRDQMLAARGEAMRAARELVEAQKAARSEIDRRLRDMRAELEAQMREQMAALEPLQKQVAQMQEGVWTMGLYLGVGEEIRQVVAGDPAPAGTPITLRQMVLRMDEETAAFPESGGLDFRRIDVFDAWVADPAHLDQLIPEPRGVVVLTPRATRIDYGDPLLNAAFNAENFASYWLIRNGAQVYRLSADFKVGKHLVPTSREFTALFQHRNFDGTITEMTPGSREWMEAEEQQSAGSPVRHPGVRFAGTGRVAAGIGRR